MKILFTKKKILFNCKSLSGGNACLPATCLSACCLPVCLMPVYLLASVYLLPAACLSAACLPVWRAVLPVSLPASIRDPTDNILACHCWADRPPPPPDTAALHTTQYTHIRHSLSQVCPHKNSGDG